MLILLLSGCPKGADTPSGRTPLPDRTAEASRPSHAPALRTLVGLYEGRGEPAHQMCVVKRGRSYGFGLVVWGGNTHSCSGSGTITRNGSRVELVMEGDSPCTLAGTISGKTIRLGEEQPAGCAYYCGARARLGGAELSQAGSTTAAAMEARDLVGEPLCAGT